MLKLIQYEIQKKIWLHQASIEFQQFLEVKNMQIMYFSFLHLLVSLGVVVKSVGLAIL